MNEAGAAGLAALRARPQAAVVALDYDGTLAPIVTRPEDARPAAGAVPVLRALAPLVGRLAVISGRAAADVVAIGGLAAVPGLLVAGNYGLERWSAGRLEVPAPPAALAAVRAALDAIVAAAPPGVHLEDKGQALVVHTRPAADPAGALRLLTGPVTGVAEASGLEVVPGRYVLEVRPRGVDKGLALRSVVGTRRPSAVLYAGDDAGDLPAFAALAALRGEGVPTVGVAVAGSGETPEAVAAAADLVLPDPAAVVGWLRGLAAELGSAG